MVHDLGSVLCRRYPNYTVGRLVVATITALICGITWWGEGSLPDGPAEISNINNLVGSLYASLAFMGARPLLARATLVMGLQKP